MGNPLTRQSERYLSPVGSVPGGIRLLLPRIERDGTYGIEWV